MNIPIFLLSFLKRYWKLLIVFVILQVLGKIDAVTYTVGPIFYLIQMGVSAVVVALFIRHAFYTHTLDAFSQQGAKDPATGKPLASDFENAWLGLEPSERLKWSLIMMAVFFLGICHIAASLAK
jgi:hypothetical protein